MLKQFENRREEIGRVGGRKFVEIASQSGIGIEPLQKVRWDGGCGKHGS
jgi:hypothetical protein